jgi:hypothetical protein
MTFTHHTLVFTKAWASWELHMVDEKIFHPNNHVPFHWM